MKRSVSNGVDVWRSLKEVRASVVSNVLIAVHTKPPVGVH